MRTTILFFLTATLASAAPKAGDAGSPEFEKATALVNQLGSPRFAVREEAGKQLVAMGGAAIPALTAGLKSSDTEIWTRCTTLLPQARAAVWRIRADAFLADVAGKQKHDLPLFDKWERLTGKPDTGSRTLFADMIRSNGDVMARVAADPKAAADDVKARCRTVLAETLVGPVQLKRSVGDLAALFFLYHLLDLELPSWRREVVEWNSDHVAHLLANPGLVAEIKSKTVGPALRRVVAAWADGRLFEDQVSIQCFALMIRANPFEEAVPSLIRWAKEPLAQKIHVRILAIDALGQIANADSIKALTDLADDRTALYSGSEFHVGDHALAAILRAQKKNLGDYGLTESLLCKFKEGRGGEGVVVGIVSFENGEAQTKGLKKWKDELAKNNDK